MRGAHLKRISLLLQAIIMTRTVFSVWLKIIVSFTKQCLHCLDFCYSNTFSLILHAHMSLCVIRCIKMDENCSGYLWISKGFTRV